MKKFLILIILAMILGGCQDQISSAHQYNAQAIADAYERKQSDLIATFKEAYPDNWEEKLLEYELQQEIVQKQKQALYQQNELIRQYQARQNWQNFWGTFNENYQRELDRQAYGRQPVIITHPRNPNYYQEQLAQQQLWDAYRKKYNTK